MDKGMKKREKGKFVAFWLIKVDRLWNHSLAQKPWKRTRPEQGGISEISSGCVGCELPVVHPKGNGLSAHISGLAA